jgi:hypothetical protein
MPLSRGLAANVNADGQHMDIQGDVKQVLQDMALNTIILPPLLLEALMDLVIVRLFV